MTWLIGCGLVVLILVAAWKFFVSTDEVILVRDEALGPHPFHAFRVRPWQRGVARRAVAAGHFRFWREEYLVLPDAGQTKEQNDDEQIR